mgnify:CR=1 FL=1
MILDENQPKKVGLWQFSDKKFGCFHYYGYLCNVKREKAMKRLTIFLFSLLLGLASTYSQGVVEIVFNGTKASYNIPDSVTGVKVGTNGARVTVVCTNTEKEYTYRVSGSSDNGSLTITGEYKLKLQLAGLTLTNKRGGAAINVDCGKRIDVVLEDSTENTICDSNLGTQKGAFYIRGHAEFKGGGTLNVTGLKGHAICVKEYCELKSSVGTINILGAVTDGIHCGEGQKGDLNNYFLMKAGVLNISNTGGDGVDTNEYGVLNIEGGEVNISVSDDNIGLKADSTVNISGGTINIDVPGQDSKAIRANHTVNISGGTSTLNISGNGSKGIKANRYEENSTVLNGGYIYISGGETNINVTGGHYITTDSEGVADTTKCMGISIDADMVQTDGTVTITTKGSEARGYNVKGDETRTGGSFIVKSDDDETQQDGDVNDDGSVDVADISAVISQMAGTSSYDKADVNSDGSVDVADISAIITIMSNN